MSQCASEESRTTSFFESISEKFQSSLLSVRLLAWGFHLFKYSRKTCSLITLMNRVDHPPPFLFEMLIWWKQKTHTNDREIRCDDGNLADDCMFLCFTFACANHVVGAIGHDPRELEVDNRACVPRAGQWDGTWG